MELLFCFCIAFLPAINTVSPQKFKRFSNDPVKETETVFASVIQNITRVNNVLQELIKNYEKLQEIYKSQENIETFTSDDEIDEVYKNKLKSIKNSKPSERAVTPNSFSATEMIWDETVEENDEKKEEEDKSEKDEEDSKLSDESGDKTPHVIESLSSGKIKETEVVFIDNHNEDDYEEKKIELTSKTEAPQVSIPTKNMYIEEKKETNKSYKEKVNKLSVENKQSVIRTRENINNHSKIQPQWHVPRMPKVEKKIYTETFSAKKIWDEIINNKPIQLEPHSEVSMEALRKNYNDERHSKGEANVFVTTNKGADNNTRDLDMENTSSVKDEFMATVLRQAYGDACLKLVVRKCYKALKAVNKAICSQYECKSNYKEKFLDYSKKGCINEFVGNNTEEDKKTNKIKIKTKGDKRNKKHVKAQEVSVDDDDDVDVDTDALFARNNEKGKPTDEKFATREGYMTACLPHIETELKEFQENKKSVPIASNETTQTSSRTSEFNILRDRFEKACKKLSTQKCVDACLWVTDNICDTYSCSSKKKKAYRTSCTKQCKNIYENTVSYKSSDSSSDSDSEDSDSDTDTS